MKVYIVLRTIEHEGSEVVEVFSDRDDASEHTRKMNSTLKSWMNSVSYEIEEREVVGKDPHRNLEDTVILGEH
jgi:hypothetical protein